MGRSRVAAPRHTAPPLASSTLIVMTLSVILTACGGGGGTTPATSSAQASSATSSASPTSAVTSPGQAASTPGTTAAFAYVPLWPFASVSAAEKWQREATLGGHQPWHLDAGQVAVAFAQQYLRFGEIDAVVRRTVGAADARVTLGYTVDGQSGTAAVLHLVRIGSGAMASRPWEVVGTDDKATFSLTRPRYGSTVSGTITVGGRIAGVDESIRVSARQLSGLVGGYCCLPAGAPAPWSVPLRLTSTHPGAITIVASTGGHLTTVERFAITGLRSGG